MIHGISLVLLALVAAPSLPIARQPNAAELLDRIAPYQGWIGWAFVLWGGGGVASAVFGADAWSGGLLWPVTLLAGGLVEIGAGFALGCSLVRDAALRARLAPLQGRLGVVSLALGVWIIAASFLR